MPDSMLLCRAGCRCALPLEHVVEVMRPLPLEPLAHSPEWMLGLSVIRGVPTPVVDLSRLLGQSSACRRLVHLKVGARRVALAVDQVEGVRRVPRERLGKLPPLLGPEHAELMGALGTLDEELLLVLNRASVLSEEIWETITASPTEAK